MKNKDKNIETPPLVKIFGVVLANWYWYIISLIICISAGYLYTKTLSYQYRAEATILIKSADNNGKADQFYSESSVFADLGIGSGANLTENEMVILKSSKLLKTAIERLELSINYSVKPLMRQADIYGANPIAVDIVESVDNKFEFIVSPDSTNTYSYSIGDNLFRAKFGDTIQINNTKLVVETTNYWGNGFTFNDITVKSLDIDAYLKDISSRLFISRTDRITSSVLLSLIDKNKKRAEDILDTLIDVYNEIVIADKNNVAQNTERFIAERINLIYADLENVDGRIEEFKKDNKIADFDNVTSAAYEYRSKYTDILNDINLQKTIIESIKPHINQSDTTFNVIMPNKAYVDLGLSEQIDNYNELILKYNDLIKNSGVNNPILIKLKEEINFSKANVQIAVDNILSNLEIQKRDVLSQESNINAQIASLPTKEKVVKDVMREQSIKEQLYLYLLNKREANALQLAITESNATIIESAKAPLQPVSPNIPIIILISGVMGIALPSLVLLLLALSDNKIYTKEDVEEITSIPIISVLPKKSKGQENEDIIVKDTSRDALTEAFRVLRSNISFFIQGESKSCNVIQLTSCTPGEGKTFVSLNLAISISNSHKNVLIIDLDLRRGGLSKILGDGTKQNGISAFLSGKIDSLDDIISSYSERLDYIPTGKLPPNATNLLSSNRFSEMIETLKGRYDYIILDSAPYFAVADSQIINPNADLTIWVLRSGRLPKTALSDMDGLNSSKKVKNMSILISDLDYKSKRYGYGYGYGYGETDKK